MMASDAAFIRASTSKLNEPFSLDDLPDLSSAASARNPAASSSSSSPSTDAAPIPDAVLSSALAHLSTTLSTARKPKLAPSVAAYVVEQVTACREERAVARKRKEAAVRRKGRVRVPAPDQQRSRKPWWDDLPEEWVGEDDDESEPDADLADRYADALQRVRTLYSKRAKLRQQVAHYQRLESLFSNIDTVVLSTMVPTDDANALTKQLERTRKSVEAHTAVRAKRRRTESQNTMTPSADMPDGGSVAALRDVLSS